MDKARKDEIASEMVLDAIAKLMAAACPDLKYICAIERDDTTAQGCNMPKSIDRFNMVEPMLMVLLQELKTDYDLSDEKEFINFVTRERAKRAKEWKNG